VTSSLACIGTHADGFLLLSQLALCLLCTTVELMMMNLLCISGLHALNAELDGFMGYS